METDTRRRGPMGVVCSVDAQPNGKLRVVLDDVKNTSESGQGPWKHDYLFTFKDYERASLEKLELMSEKELAEFGYNVLVRLLVVTRNAT